MIFFKNIELLPLLWLIALLIPLLWGEYFLKIRQKEQFSGRAGHGIIKQDQLRRVFYTLMAVSLLFTALLRPSWNPSVQIVEQEGRDVVFLLDVSRSMTAGDVAPSRLERAKLEISETIQTIQGDRIALVAFAGNSVVKCPLTLDYGFFSMILKDISPQSVSRGGSQLGDALRMVESSVFDDQAREQRDIILITDGEDQESFPVEAAQTLGSQGVRLIVIGLGDSLQGARVKDDQGNYLTYEGQEIWSKMDGDTLRKIAAATPGGRYLEAGKANFSLPQIYKTLITQGAEKSTGQEETLVYEEKFQFFLALALIFMILESLRVIGPVNLKELSKKIFFTGRGKILILIMILTLWGVMSPSAVYSEGRADLFLKGEEALANHDWGTFEQAYDSLSEKGADRGKLIYNRGRSLYEQEDYKGAADSFGEAASLLEGKKASRALYNRGNALLKQGETDQENQQVLTSQAVEAFEKALELDPLFKEAARNLEILKSQDPQPQDDSQQGDNSQDDKQSSEDQQKQQDNQNNQDNQDSHNEKGDETSPPPNEQNDQNQDSRVDRQAQEILNQEEDNREEREATLHQAGGIYQVERDW